MQGRGAVAAGQCSSSAVQGCNAGVQLQQGSAKASDGRPKGKA